jgi:protein gp37
MGQPRYRNGFEPTMHPEMLALPSQWKKPRRVFVNSMSDLFHESIPIAFIEKVFDAISDAPWHTFQVLTKRSGRLRSLSDRLPWPRNLWMGVTVESIRHLPRIDDLRASGASLKFISFEPLLGSVPASDLDGIDWVITGGESGPHARPMAEEWVKDIRDACVAQSVPFFFKQWGGWNSRARGRFLDSRIWNESPKYPEPQRIPSRAVTGVTPNPPRVESGHVDSPVSAASGSSIFPTARLQ